MYRTFADVVTKSDLDEQAKQAGERPLTPPIEGGKPLMSPAFGGREGACIFCKRKTGASTSSSPAFDRVPAIPKIFP